MKEEDAMNIILKNRERKYRVHFEKVEGSILKTDYFPEREEPCIESEEKAWMLAVMFAEATFEKCVNIYVVDEKWQPVPGYKEKIIKNR